MNKRIMSKYSILGVITIMMLCFSFFGCGGANGSFYTLTELYEDGSISREDLMNIAALRTGSVCIIKDIMAVEWELEEIEFDVAAPSVALSDSVSKKIESEFKRAKGGKFTSFTMKYYGTYGQFVVVEIRYSIKDEQVAAVITPIAVSDIYFGTISPHSQIVVWGEKDVVQ